MLAVPNATAAESANQAHNAGHSMLKRQGEDGSWKRQQVAVRGHLHAGVCRLQVAGEAALHYLGDQQRVRLVAHLRAWTDTSAVLMKGMSVRHRTDAGVCTCVAALVKLLICSSSDRRTLEAP